MVTIVVEDAVYHPPNRTHQPPFLDGLLESRTGKVLIRLSTPPLWSKRTYITPRGEARSGMPQSKLKTKGLVLDSFFQPSGIKRLCAGPHSSPHSTFSPAKNPKTWSICPIVTNLHQSSGIVYHQDDGNGAAHDWTD
jgi:hypothetical protein